MAGAAASVEDPLEAAFQEVEGPPVHGNHLKKLAMKLASQIFNDQERKRVDDAVAQAEKRTSSEIVPVVATSSGRYDRAEDIVGLFVGLIVVAVIWWQFPSPAAHETGAWDGTPRVMEILLLFVSMIVGFIMGVCSASRLFWLRRLFTPKRQMKEEVETRACQVYFDSSIHHTSGGTGVLIYISLYERLAVVLGDKTVVEKLGQEGIDELCETLTRFIKEDITQALVDTIQSTGDKLEPVLPRAKTDANELSDSLITID